jgi:hypothetical protein
VGQVPAGVEAHAQDRVARLGERQEHGLIGLAPGARLHIGETATEEPGHSGDRKLLGDVDVLAAAIIAPARIAFRIFVGHDRALRLQHGAGHDILRRDQLDLVLLALELGGNGRRDLRIGLGQRRCEKGFGSRRVAGEVVLGHLSYLCQGTGDVRCWSGPVTHGAR